MGGGAGWFALDEADTTGHAPAGTLGAHGRVDNRAGGFGFRRSAAGRLSRRYDKELAELRQLQQDRKAKEREALATAARAALLARQRHESFDPQANGFDFSTEEIDRYIRTLSPPMVDRILRSAVQNDSLPGRKTRTEAA